MTRSKPAAIPPSNTSHLFDGRKKGSDRGAVITSERIASDLTAFRKAGGHIEILGVTQALKKIGGADQSLPQTANRDPSPRRRGG